MTTEDARRILDELGYNDFTPTIVRNDDFYADKKKDGKLIADLNILVHFSIRSTIYNEAEYYSEDNEKKED